MEHFTAHCLRFECEVVEPIRLNEHAGSAIRGALYHALLNGFCMNRQARGCNACPLAVTCPVAFLVSTLDPESDRGANVPRPYVVQPPLDGKVAYAPGETLTFGLTMFARALNLFPYVVLAIRRLESGGLGKRMPENGYRRGTFRVRQVWAENPLTGERQAVLQQDNQVVQVPDIPITNEQVASQRSSKVASRRNSDAAQGEAVHQRVTVELLTPLRLVEGGRLMQQMAFRPFVQRLHGRLRQLSAEYSDTPLDFDFRQVLAQAETVRVVHDATRWVELESYSTRLKRATPIGGLMGQVTFEGDLTPFWDWLVWGQFTHVGKDAVKGNGWYRISEEANQRRSESAKKRISEWRIANQQMAGKEAR